MNSKEAEQLIRHSFAHTAKPLSSQIITCECCKDHAKGLAGREWTELSIEDVRPYTNDLPLFTDEAFSYYLPAFLIHAMQPKESHLSEFVFYDLSTRQKRHRLFTQPQVMAIIAYLESLSACSSDDGSGYGNPTATELQDTLKYWNDLAKSAT